MKHLTNNDTNETSQQQPYFVHVADAVLWDGRNLVKALIDMYELYSCLWDFNSLKECH